MFALEISDLYKTYSSGLQALKGISLQVEKGDFFALLGPNGAGKSTCIGIISGLVNKTSGGVSIFGHSIDREFIIAKSLLGSVPQEFNFNTFEPVEEIVINQAGFYGVPPRRARIETEHYLKQLGLWQQRRSQARRLSGGMKRRLMIARALVHKPKLLILDEPTAGVDIELRRSMWDFLEQINEQGTTIILTTHYLEEAERMCHNIAIIDEGIIIQNSSMKHLLKQLNSETFVLYLRNELRQAPTLSGFDNVLSLDPQSIEVEVPNKRSINDLINQLEAQGIVVERMRNKVNRLEELFVKMTSKASKTGVSLMLYQFWIAYLTITRREIYRFTRIWVQTIIPPVVMVALYFIIFGNLIGQRIGEMDGLVYIDFIMPGLVMMSIITNSYTNVVSSFYGAKYSRHIEEMQIAPVPDIVILLGFVSGGMARGLCVGIAVTLVSLLFTEFRMHSPLVVLLVALLTSCLFSLAGLINAIFANSFDDITIIPTFVLTPLTYLGGIFYSIKMLPEFWQTASLGNPILYMVNSFRYGFRGTSDIDLANALLVILFFIALLFTLCMILLSRGIGIRQ